MNFSSNMVFLNRSFDKKRLKALLLWFRLNLSEGAALEAVEILQGLGFRSATQGAISLGLDDLKTPTSKGGRVFQAQLEVALAHHEHHRGNRTPVELFQHLVDTWHRTSQDLTAEVVQLFHSTERVNPVYMMAFSGARGNLSQVRQLVGMRGLMADPRGQIVGFPILSNFREGLTITEYFVSCYGARKGVVDTAIRTADAGYLTRRLADVSHHFVVRTTNCGTHRNIRLRDIKEGQKTILPLASRLVGRVLGEHISFSGSSLVPVLGKDCTLVHGVGLRKEQGTSQIAHRNEEITPELASKLASQCSEVSVRSPLSCSLRWGVCQLCYGWGLSEGRRVTLGEAVGIIAAQSIGEPGTQLTLRTFHTGGVFSGDLLDEIRAPYSGTVFFPEPLQGLLVRTPHGQIAFLTKVSGKMNIFSTTAVKSSTNSYEPALQSVSISNDGTAKELKTNNQPLDYEESRFDALPQLEAFPTTPKETKGSKGIRSLKQNNLDFLSISDGKKRDDKKEEQLEVKTKQNKEFTLQPSTVIFVRQREEVFPNQLLAEFSSSTLQPINDQIEVTQQVLSEAAGQVWFKEIEYGNRKGPGSGSLGTHFSSQKLGGIWVLSGKSTDEIFLNSRRSFPNQGMNLNMSFLQPRTFSSSIYDGKMASYSKKQARSENKEPCILQEEFKSNISCEQLRYSKKNCLQPYLNQQNRLKEYKTSVITLHHDNHLFKYHYSLGYSQFMSFVSSENNKVTSIYLNYLKGSFKNKENKKENLKASLLKETACAEQEKKSSWDMEMSSGWRSYFKVDKQKRGLVHQLHLGCMKQFEKTKKKTSSSVSFSLDRLGQLHQPMEKTLRENIKYQGTNILHKNKKNIRLVHPKKQGLYGWIISRYCAKLTESVLVKSDHMTSKVEQLRNILPNVVLPASQAKTREVSAKPFRNFSVRETVAKIHFLLGNNNASVQLPLTWWLLLLFQKQQPTQLTNKPKKWKTTSGILLGEPLLSHKEKTQSPTSLVSLSPDLLISRSPTGEKEKAIFPHCQLFWLSSSLLQQDQLPKACCVLSTFCASAKSLVDGEGSNKEAEESGINPTKKSQEFSWHINRFFSAQDLSGFFKENSLDHRNDQSKNRAGIEISQLNFFKGQQPRYLGRLALAASCFASKKQGQSLLAKQEAQVVKNLSDKKLSVVYDKKAKSGLILYQPLDFFFEVNKSPNTLVRKRLIETLNLTCRQYSSTSFTSNREIFSPLEQDYTFECFADLINSKISKPIGILNTDIKGKDVSKEKVDNLLTFNSFWQPLSLTNYPNKVQLAENKFRDFSEHRPLSVTSCTFTSEMYGATITHKKSVDYKDKGFALKCTKKHKVVTYQRLKYPKTKGQRSTTLVQKPIWLSIHISKANLLPTCADSSKLPFSSCSFLYTKGFAEAQKTLSKCCLPFVLQQNLWSMEKEATKKQPRFLYIKENKEIRSKVETGTRKRPIERNDGNLDQHIVHTINLPIVSFPYIIPPRFKKSECVLENLSLTYNSGCDTPVQGKLLPLIRQSFWVAIACSTHHTSSMSRVQLRTSPRTPCTKVQSLPSTGTNEQAKLPKACCMLSTFWASAKPLVHGEESNKEVEESSLNFKKYHRKETVFFKQKSASFISKTQSLNAPLCTKVHLVQPREQTLCTKKKKVHRLGEDFSKIDGILLERLKHLENLNKDKEKFINNRIFSSRNLNKMKPKSLLFPQEEAARQILAASQAKNYTLFTFLSSSLKYKILQGKEIPNNFYLRVADLRFVVSLPIKVITNPQGRYTSPVLKLPSTIGGVSSSMAGDKGSRKEAKKAMPLFGKSSQNQAYVTQGTYTNCCTLMRRLVEYPVQCSSFNRWASFSQKKAGTRRRKLKYSPFSTNLISKVEIQAPVNLPETLPVNSHGFDLIKDSISSTLSSLVAAPFNEQAKKQSTIDGGSFSKKEAEPVFSSKENKESKDLYSSKKEGNACSLIPAFEKEEANVCSMHHTSSMSRVQPRTSLRTPCTIHLRCKGATNEQAKKLKKSLKKVSTPFLCESDQITFATSDVLKHSVLLSSYQKKTCSLEEAAPATTIWQFSSLPEEISNPMEDAPVYRRRRKEANKERKKSPYFSGDQKVSDVSCAIVEFERLQKIGDNKDFKEKQCTISKGANKLFYLFPGQLVAYGEKIAPNFATTESGQVLYVDSQRATFRKAQTVLIYSQAILAVLSGDWIQKGSPLMALSYQKLVTGDIVQGLPKIEQFFEAPLLKDGTFWSDSLQAKLNLFFQEHREKLPLAEAVRKGFSDIQRVLVEGVQRVYIAQGVLIADKHLEVIVRQMTCKGRILYSGDTGFLRNELVSLDKIESVNQVTYGQKALYHPQVRGITDASLESESFLSAASFQETTRVLSRDAVIGKTDLMRGLKERVIVGELIQAGTGLANNSVYNLLLN